MASTRTYRWKAGDQVWFIGARFLAESGFDSVSVFVEQIRDANPHILDWATVDVGALITVPYASS